MKENVPFEWIGTIPMDNPSKVLTPHPSGKILIANLPPFSNICPRWDH